MQILSKCEFVSIFSIFSLRLVSRLFFLFRLDWKKLRNKYLEEQRKKMHELKEQLQKASRIKLEKCKAKQEEENENCDNVATDETKPSEFRVKFTPGVIVRLQLDSPIKDVKQFKVSLKFVFFDFHTDVNANRFVFVSFRTKLNVTPMSHTLT